MNHLAKVLLLDALLTRDTPPRTIVFVSSATHDPAVRTGTPPPLEAKPTSYARQSAQVGMRADTTSKLLTTAAVRAYQRKRPDVTVLSFDPGLMQGTGLARHASAFTRALWHSVLKPAGVLPFASTPASRAPHSLTAHR